MLRSISDHGQLLTREQACARVPALRREQVLGAVYEPDASDIDVHGLHQGYLRGMREQGGRLQCNAEVHAVGYRDGLWHVTAGATRHAAPVLINAAGAWCDAVAALAGVAPIELVPKRRSAFVFAPPRDLDCSAWPLCAGIDESWYIKPDVGLLLGSPAANAVAATRCPARRARHRARGRSHRDDDDARGSAGRCGAGPGLRQSGRSPDKGKGLRPVGFDRDLQQGLVLARRDDGRTFQRHRQPHSGRG